MITKINYILIAVFGLLSLTSCEQFTDVDEAYISTSPDFVNYYLRITDIGSNNTFRISGDGGGEKTFIVEYTKDVTWEITDVPEWLTINPQNGGDTNGQGGDRSWVTLTSEPNISGKVRTATLHLKSTVPGWNYEYEFYVEQDYSASSTIKDAPKVTITSLSIKEGSKNLLSGEAVVEETGNNVIEAGFIYSIGSGNCSYEECTDFNDWCLKKECEIVDNKISIKDVPVNNRFYYYTWADVRAYLKLVNGKIIYSGKPIYVGITLPYPHE